GGGRGRGGGTGRDRASRWRKGPRAWARSLPAVCAKGGARSGRILGAHEPDRAAQLEAAGDIGREVDSNPDPGRGDLPRQRGERQTGPAAQSELTLRGGDEREQHGGVAAGPRGSTELRHEQARGPRLQVVVGAGSPPE